MKKLGKLEVRRIWVIFSLFNCEKWLHDDLTYHLNEIDKKILENYVDERKQIYNAILPDLKIAGHKPLDNLELTLEEAKIELDRPDRKISKEMMSKVLKSLRVDEIIRRTNVEKDGRGPDPYEYSLIDDLGALKKVLEIFYDPDLDHSFSSILGSKFISSFYAKKMIPILLETVIENNGFSFNDKEKKSVLNILLSSPRAVLAALEYVNRLDTGFRPAMSLESEYGNGVELFLLRLQLKLGEDLIHLAIPNDIKSFEYNITVSFAGDQIAGDNISKVIDEDSVKTTILPKFSEDKYFDIMINPDYSPL